jgi:hypothetical protein
MPDTKQMPQMPQMPNFLEEAKQGGKSVGERQKEYAARTAPPGAVPVVLTEALQNEARLKAELAGTEADVQRGIALKDRYDALLRRRDVLVLHVKRGEELLAMFNDSLSSNSAIDSAIETATIPVSIFSSLVQLSAIPFAREYFTGFIARKQAELAQARQDLEAFAKEHGVKQSQ